MSDETKTYRASFTLEQTGDSVRPIVTYEPKVDKNGYIPPIYDMIGDILMKFLRQVNLLNEANEFVDEETYEQTQVRYLMDDSNGGETKH